jgi:hypothetical protein
MNVPFPGGWRYALGATGGWLLFLALLVAVPVAREQSWPRALVALLALAPTVIAALQFYVAYRVVAAQDEFVRGLFAKRMLVAGALVILVATAWSGAELLGASHLPAWLLYPLFWGLFGAVTPLIKGSTP